MHACCSLLNKVNFYSFQSSNQTLCSRVHLSHIIASVDYVPIFEQMKSKMSEGVEKLREITGTNLAVLRLYAAEMEEREQVKMFADIDLGGGDPKKKKKKGRKAVLKTLGKKNLLKRNF